MRVLLGASRGSRVRVPWPQRGCGRTTKNLTPALDTQFHLGPSYPFGRVSRPSNPVLIPVYSTTGLILFTGPLNPGAAILNMYLPSNSLGLSLFILLMLALLTMSKLLTCPILNSLISGLCCPSIFFHRSGGY